MFYFKEEVVVIKSWTYLPFAWPASSRDINFSASYCSGLWPIGIFCSHNLKSLNRNKMFSGTFKYTKNIWNMKILESKIYLLNKKLYIFLLKANCLQFNSIKNVDYVESFLFLLVIIPINFLHEGYGYHFNKKSQRIIESYSSAYNIQFSRTWVVQSVGHLTLGF